MRIRLLRGRVTSAIAVGVIVVVAVGGGYAAASVSGGSSQIRACSQKTHVLYTGSCKKGDAKLSWNKQGPPGPGATSVVFNANGTASPIPTSLGTIGAYTMSASCVQPSQGTTTANLFVSGPAGELDGMTAQGGAGEAPDVEKFGAISGVPLYGGVTSSGTPAEHVSNYLWLPSSGTAAEAMTTVYSVGGATNACHISVFVTPAGSTTAFDGATQSGVPIMGGKARLGRPAVRAIP
jgi:hypothetical protein